MKNGTRRAPSFRRQCLYASCNTTDGRALRTPKDRKRSTLPQGVCDFKSHPLDRREDRERRRPYEGRTMRAISCIRRTRNRRARASGSFRRTRRNRKYSSTAAFRNHQARYLVPRDGWPRHGEAIRSAGILRHDTRWRVGLHDFIEKRSTGPRKSHRRDQPGRYYAPRLRAMKPRYAACIAWGRNGITRHRKERSTFVKTSLRLPGNPSSGSWGRNRSTSVEEAGALQARRTCEKMRCPFLLVHGRDDEQIPLADAQKQFDACGSRDKTSASSRRGWRRAALPRDIRRGWGGDGKWFERNSFAATRLRVSYRK